MKKLRPLSVFLCVCLAVIIAFAAPFTTPVRAESTTYSFEELLAQDKVKVLGRHTPGMVTTFWSGCGVELNVETAGGEMRIDIATTDKPIYYEAFVDGQSIGRTNLVSQQQPYAVFSVPAGKHTVRVVKDTTTSKAGDNFVSFEKLTFDGTVLERPADKDMYIEILGASSTAGAGTLGVYKYGDVHHYPQDHSVTHAYSYMVPEDLNADYSIVAAGGIGMYEVSEGKQEKYEGVPSTIQEIYRYTNGFIDLGIKENEYDFARKPDLVLIRIGGNDDTTHEEDWKKLAVELVELIREKNYEEIPIVWMETETSVHYRSLFELSRKELYGPNFYVMPLKSVKGLGSAALPTQTSGHINAAQHRDMADAIEAFLHERGLDKPVPDEVKYAPKKDKTEEKTDGKDDGDKKSESSFFGSIGFYIPIAAAVVIAVICVIFAVSKKKKQPAAKDGQKPDEKEPEEPVAEEKPEEKPDGEGSKEQ